MLKAQQLQEKWEPVLNHSEMEPIKDSYKRAVTAVILENQERAMKEDHSFLSEAAPTTDTGSLTDYVPPMKTKKKKDMTYDGRTRNVKELVRRIMTRREKRNARRS